MNLVLLEPHELCDGRAVLAGRRAAHIVSVHRAEAGRTLRVGVVGGEMGRATVRRADAAGVELDVTLGEAPPPPLACTLVLAMPRPKVLRRVLAAAASFGIPRIFLSGANRVEKSYWQSPLASDDGIREALLRGLEQGGDTRLPVVERRTRFRPFVEDELPAIARGSVALVAHPRAATACEAAGGRAVTLFVGPEGGFVDFELELLEAAGFRRVSLGERALRVETAVAALVGRLF